MRLFIAINFEKSVNDKIQKVIEIVNKSSTQGRFVSDEHLHFTLEFLGDISLERIENIKNSMDKILDDEFIIKLNKLGSFKRRDGHIYWLGVEENKNLLDLQSNLHKSLLKDGFKLETRPYKPHITLGRKIKLNEDFDFNIINDEIRDIKIKVKKVDLMESKHAKGRLSYKVIHSRRLG